MLGWAGCGAERSAVSSLESQLGTVKEAVAKEQDLTEKLKQQAAMAAESAQRQVSVACLCSWHVCAAGCLVWPETQNM